MTGFDRMVDRWNAEGKCAWCGHDLDEPGSDHEPCNTMLEGERRLSQMMFAPFVRRG
jgi:hypothetical protein